MNHIALLTEHPFRRALDQFKREDTYAIEQQAKKTARAYEAWQEERRRLEAMYLARTNLRG